MLRIFRQRAPRDAPDRFVSRDLAEDELDLIAGGLPGAPFGLDGQESPNPSDPGAPGTKQTDRPDLWL